MGADQSQISSVPQLDRCFVNPQVGPSPSPGLNSVSFKINGELYTVTLDDPTSASLAPSAPNPSSKSRLVDFIRDKALLKGTKYMCREGGCGACVVSVTTKDSVTGADQVKSVNSCLVPLLSCDGWDITTIEKLGNKSTGYHPIQKQMAKLGGTQCGFCTPGMIMHMYSFLQNGTGSDGSGPKPKLKDIEDSLDGNICRCTGYRPILDAFKSFGASDIEEKPVCPMKTLDAHRVRRSSDEFELLQHDTTKVLMPRRPGTHEVWVKASSLQDAFAAMGKFAADNVPYRIVAGNTSTGIYKEDTDSARGFIDILNINSLSTYILDSNEVILGSCVTITSAINILRQHASVEGFNYVGGISQHLKRVANTSVRNIATVGGNLMLKHTHNEFPSDLCTIFEAVGALLKIATDATTSTMYTVHDFLALDMKQRLILSIHLKPLRPNYVYRSYKVSKRFQNALPIVNAAFLFNVDKAQNFKLTEPATIVYFGITPTFLHAEQTEAVLAVGKSLQDSKTVQDAMEALGTELQPDERPVLEGPAYRKLVAQSLLYKAILSILGTSAPVKSEYQSGGRGLKRGTTSGAQVYDTDRADWPLNQPLPKIESAIQCSGEAEYINDIHPDPNELIGVFVVSTVANADIDKVDASEALKDPDVVRFIQAGDVPGKNDYMIGSGGTPEPIFASGHVDYAGQPIGLLIAKNQLVAHKAAKLVRVSYKNVKKPILNIREALRQEQKNNRAEPPPKQPATPPKSQKVKGEFEIGRQYHFHMETQICICKPKEGGIDVISSTQWMDFVQDAISGATGLPVHEVYVQVRRLGGAYGAKITRAAHVAAACGVGAYLTNRPLRIATSLEENMEIIGKRPPYLVEYDVDVEEATGKITSLTAHITCDAGVASNEESFAGAKYFMSNCYAADKWKITGKTVNTNTASNTWCRAPGTTQGIAIIEYIMEHIAYTLGKDPVEVRTINFAQPKPTFDPERFVGVRALMRGATGADRLEQQLNSLQIEPRGPWWPTEGSQLSKMIDEAKTNAGFDERVASVKEFNKANRWKKRGLALVPMKYPLAYGGAGFGMHITVYKTDGTVALSYGGIECGQGINTKVAQTVAKEFGIAVDQVVIKPANSLTGANGDSTGGSMTSELCCWAALQACAIIKGRMKPVKDKIKKDTPWPELVGVCYRMGLDLMAEYMYTKNDPVFPYDIWAVNITEVEIDVLTGEFKIVRLDLLEDTGKSLNPEIDVGQIEGALVMGLGLWTTEKLVYDNETGQLLTKDSLHYKPPEPRDIPEDLRITLLKNAPNPLGVLRSKATGEPATCTTVCVLLALRNAIQAAREDAGNKEWFQLNGPVSTEDVLRLCLTASTQFKLD